MVLLTEILGTPKGNSNLHCYCGIHWYTSIHRKTFQYEADSVKKDPPKWVVSESRLHKSSLHCCRIDSLVGTPTSLSSSAFGYFHLEVKRDYLSGTFCGTYLIQIQSQTRILLYTFMYPYVNSFSPFNVLDITPISYTLFFI